MIVIFQCFGGTHTSVAAAALYLGQLPRKRRPRPEEILALPYFDRIDSAGIGALHYAGRGPRGESVFILGSARWGAPVRELAAPFLELAGHSTAKVAVIDCLPGITLPIRLGGFISRRLGLTAIGRPLVAWGLLRSYPRLLKLLNSVPGT